MKKFCVEEQTENIINWIKDWYKDKSGYAIVCISGGKVTISGVGDDGIQASYETEDDGTKVVDEENTGQIVIKGGTIDIEVSGAARARAAQL